MRQSQRWTPVKNRGSRRSAGAERRARDLAVSYFRKSERLASRLSDGLGSLMAEMAVLQVAELMTREAA